jgi:hypothetical protein
MFEVTQFQKIALPKDERERVYARIIEHWKCDRALCRQIVAAQTIPLRFADSDFAERANGVSYELEPLDMAELYLKCTQAPPNLMLPVGTTPEETLTATKELHAVYRLVKRAGKSCGAQVRDEIVPFGCDLVVENLWVPTRSCFA